ncbi:MAG: NAD(+)/NADH kinase [Oscillospiraceae bacterium]|jgi:NAD+ kinase|nr:NAD(+)/NADH kinase [Oscillospiraceae bacterium]
MRELLLIVNTSKPGAAALAGEVAARLREFGMDALAETSCRAFLPEKTVFLPAEEALARCDGVIALGGDGTILQAARLAMARRKPVLGINAGRLGFLAGLERHELDLLRQLREDQYETDRRMMLLAQIRDGDTVLRESCCINDAVVGRGGATRAADVPVLCENGRRLRFLGDGVIFSTPTGSTAYSLSAGGPVVDPRIESILLTPICTHLFFSRSIVFSPQAVLRAEIAQDGLTLTADAEPPLELRAGQEVWIRRADETAAFLRIKADSFLDVMERKLIRNAQALEPDLETMRDERV